MFSGVSAGPWSGRSSRAGLMRLLLAEGARRAWKPAVCVSVCHSQKTQTCRPYVCFSKRNSWKEVTITGVTMQNLMKLAAAPHPRSEPPSPPPRCGSAADAQQLRSSVTPPRDPAPRRSRWPLFPLSPLHPARRTARESKPSSRTIRAAASGCCTSVWTFRINSCFAILSKCRVLMVSAEASV